MRRRPPAPAMELDAAELERRAKWGGVGDIPVLSPSERTAWVLLQQARDTWVPRAALRYAWMRVDPVHGHGGSWNINRPRRSGDEGYGDGWNLASFRAVLHEDALEIEALIAEHPRQAGRLRHWLSRMEQLGRQRARDTRPEPHAGEYLRRAVGVGLLRA